MLKQFKTLSKQQTSLNSFTINSFAYVYLKQLFA